MDRVDSGRSGQWTEWTVDSGRTGQCGQWTEWTVDRGEGLDSVERVDRVDGVDTLRAGDYNFFYGKGSEIIDWEWDVLYTADVCQQLRE